MNLFQLLGVMGFLVGVGIGAWIGYPHGSLGIAVGCVVGGPSGCVLGIGAVFPLLLLAQIEMTVRKKLTKLFRKDGEE